jgi:hypothetical protein
MHNANIPFSLFCKAPVAPTTGSFLLSSRNGVYVPF